MARHFVTLYLTIVLTLALVSWGQDRLFEMYGTSTEELAAEHASQAAVLRVISHQLQDVPAADRAAFIAKLAGDTKLDIELLEPADVAGARALEFENPVFMLAANHRVWVMQRLADDERVLTFQFDHPPPLRGPLDWTLAFMFYAAIALVIMLWLWPITRDLRALEHATARFGDRNWSFDVNIDSRSPVFSLAQAFRRMATRIDGLISSHKDMSNALSHEIKTPLARMRFEIELARTAKDSTAVARHLDNLNTDIAELNSFVTATLEYAVLERAEVALNLGEHDFTKIVPAIADSVSRSSDRALQLTCDIDPKATKVVCDAHLMETVLRNLLYNALRHARSRVLVTFKANEHCQYVLLVEDDGPGIPKPDRTRIFESFVQLSDNITNKGFGLGLAIVKRIVEWHGGTVSAQDAEIGGARFEVRWDAKALGQA